MQRIFSESSVVKSDMTSGWPALQVELRPIERLIPYINNPRKHSPAQVAQIAASMREWGWVNPVLVDESETILAGHGRILAARQLGWTEVPVITATGWSESKKRAYVIADNKLAANATWDTLLLDAEIQALGAEHFDIELTGFSDDDLKRLEDDVAELKFGEHHSDSDGREAEEESGLTRTERGDSVALTIPMTVAQRGVVLDAITKAKRTYGVDQSGEALCKLAQLFLAAD
jgi:ParB-like chromosome segregation protein Spo0J